MEGSLLLPLGDGLVIEQISREGHQIIVSVRSTASLARCPLCAAAFAAMLSVLVAFLPEAFTKIGLDDFAFRRGRTYGTLIVNLETHRLIDVLPDRSVATVAAWLTAHPTIDVISRDRASDYATAATVGAPQAQQVCDRWHLLRNLSEYLYTFLARMRAQMRQASQEQAPPAEEARWLEREAREQAQIQRRGERRARKTVREQTKATRQEERLDRYQQMLTLKSQGLSPEEIAPRVGCSARTVRQWLADGVKTTPRRRRPSPLDTYASYLRRRWEEG